MVPLTHAGQRLVSENLGIVYSVLKALNVHGRGFEEARAEASLALCRAASTYKPERGKFSTWAWAQVRWRVMDWLTVVNAEGATHWLSREVAAEDSLDCSLAADEALSEAQELRNLRRMVLDVRHTPTEIAEYLGVDRKAVVSLRRTLSKKG
jgi:DNA-directed RNA polymerase specialized sigma subunit